MSEDYSAIPTDLVSLGFIPAGKERVVEEAGVVTVLSSVLAQLSAGGGAAKINVDQLVGELQSMTSSYGNLFQIPPYFAYILRSFTVLEGIGLASDPDYAIVQECYPTLAQRLFVVRAPIAGSKTNTSALLVTRRMTYRNIQSGSLVETVMNSFTKASQVLFRVVFALYSDISPDAPSFPLFARESKKIIHREPIAWVQQLLYMCVHMFGLFSL